MIAKNNTTSKGTGEQEGLGMSPSMSAPASATWHRDEFMTIDELVLTCIRIAKGGDDVALALEDARVMFAPSLQAARDNATRYHCADSVGWMMRAIAERLEVIEAE